jgi:eukaryotic-like serine/threonine-protein kinase
MTATRQLREMTWKRFGVYLVALVVMVTLGAVIIDQAILPAIVASAETIIVPDVKGMNEDSARTMLEELGLTVEQPHEQFNSDVAEGSVISQMPYAGATVKEGRRIYLTVSEGVESSAMPRVLGMTVREARLTLVRLGLKVGATSFETNDSIPEDRIIAQSVSVGTRVRTGTVIDLVVSKGASHITMPDLLGLSLTEVQGMLADYGLKVGHINYIATGTFEPNTVLAHVPPADSLIEPGGTVALTVTK